MSSYREDEGRTLLEYLYVHPEVEVAVDTETTGLKVADGTDCCIGVSIAFVHDGKGYGHYYGIQHETGENVSRETVEMLNWVLTQQGRDLVFANVIFDILSLQTIDIDIDTSTIFDIISMAHLINENEPFNKGVDSLALMYLGEEGKIKDPYVEQEKVSGNHNITPEEMFDYAVMDAVSTWRIKQELVQHPEWTRLPEDIWESKRELIKVLVAMKRRGVTINTELAAEMEAVGTQKMAELKAELGMNPASGKDMQKLMLEDLGLPVLKMSKPSKRFPKGQPSFTKDVMEEYDLMLERMDSPAAKLIKQYRGWQKAVTAAYRPYLALVDDDGRIRCSYKLHGTVTGRFSCSEPNLQQIPKASDKPWNGRVKECFVPQEGYTLVELDYSQLELRLGTAYANEESLKQVFLDGRDIFTEMSAELGFDRQTTKTFVYSTQYGAGVARIMAAFGVSEERAKEMLRHYHRTYPRFKATSDRFARKAEQEKFITLWSGRRRHFKYKSEGYKAMNSAIQGGAADIVERIMVRVFNELDDEDNCRLLLQVHDSLTFEIRNDLVDYYVPKIKALMEDVDGIVPERIGEGFGVRFAVEAKVWGEK